MEKFKHLFFIAIITGLINACVYHKADPLPDLGPPVSFDTVVKPVVIQRCVKCHSDTATRPDRNQTVFFLRNGNDFSVLHDYAVKLSPENSAHTDVEERIHGYDGVERMPLDGPPYLPDSTIEQIDRWIRHGAPINN